jgi:hypothetical protein
MVERWPVACEPESHDVMGRAIVLCCVAGRDLGAAMVFGGMALATTEDKDYADLETRGSGADRHACPCLPRSLGVAITAR